MGSELLNNTIQSIKAERERIWFNEPADLQILKNRIGVKNQSLTTVFYADKEMTAVTKYLYIFREISRTEEFDLETLKRATIELLKSDCGRFGPTFYKIKDTEKIFKEVIEALPDAATAEEYRSLIEELIIYANRFEQWIDRAIPWKQFADLFMAALK